MRSIEKAISDRMQKSATNGPGERNVLILGIGNLLMGDEGVGVHFIHALFEQKIEISQADIIDGGVGGFALMGYFDDYEHIIFIDATMDGKTPGSISLIEPKFASDFPQALSAHDFGLKDMIESLYLLGKMPNLYLFTVTIPSIKPMSLELSSEVQNSIPELIKKVSTLIARISNSHS
jgi:hydrogenase maturation protease